MTKLSLSALTAFFSACRAGDLAALTDLLTNEPSLARERTPDGERTGLHLAVEHVDAVRLLLQHGADPNARDAGDNAHPLHFAGGAGRVAVVRALLDAGGDVHGKGDVHQLEVIGWTCCFGPTIPQDVLALLLERGARHHVFSAIAAQDADALQKLVEEAPDALSRRMSRFEGGQSALHYAIARPDGLVGGGFRTGSHYPIVELLIELGADIEAEDDKARTPLALAMLLGDRKAMRRLKDAGAKEPKPTKGPEFATRMSELANSVRKMDPMIQVPNVKAAVEWYQSMGFELESAHSIDTDAAWAGVYLGGAFVMFIPGGEKQAHHPVSFWIRTNRIDDLYQALKKRQLERASDVLAGREPKISEARFKSDLHDTFYGEREFCIVDLNGYELNFAQTIAS